MGREAKAKIHRADLVRAFGPVVADVINAYGDVLFRRSFFGRLKWLILGR
jgi:hypothetical protein